MILAAIYVIDNFLFENPQIINFGGEYLYDFIFDEKANEIEVKRIKNQNYISNFFGKNISNVSAIVGANGAGKTSIFKMLTDIKDTSKAIRIYEGANQNFKVQNTSGNKNERGEFTNESSIKVVFDGKIIESTPHSLSSLLYYSSIPSIDSSNFYSPLEFYPKTGDTYEDFLYEEIGRIALFLNSEIIDVLVRIYKDLPVFDSYEIFAAIFSKDEFKNVYAKSNLGKITNEILEKVWSHYGVQNKENSYFLHNGSSFLKNIEVILLSFLMLNSTGMKTKFNGSYLLSLDEILEKNNFRVVLKHLLCQKISYIDKYLYQYISEYLNYSYYTYGKILTMLDEFSVNSVLKGKEEKIIKKLLSVKKRVEKGGKNFHIKNFVMSELTEMSSDLDGEEFEEIRINLERFLRVYSVPMSQTESQMISSALDLLNNLEEGIIHTFSRIYGARKEIKSQIIEGAKYAILLFESIENLYDFLLFSNRYDGFEIKDGKLEVNLKRADINNFSILLKLFEKVRNYFNQNSVLDFKLFKIIPSRRMSFGESRVLSLFSSFYEFSQKKTHHQRQDGHYLVLLDEADLGFHPLWKRKFVSALIKVLPEIFKRLEVRGKRKGFSPQLQIILTTHDPLTLSDLPNKNVTYIKKLSDTNSKILTLNSQDDRPNNSFGANISDLMSHSFFVDGGLVGDFASEKINETIAWLNFKRGLEYNKKYAIIDDAEYHKQLIELIDEPIVKHKLRQMYIEVTNDKDSIIREIERLQLKIKEDD